MPIFEYACPRCGKIFERYQRSAEEAAAACPHCGSGDVKKIMSSFSSHVSGAVSGRSAGSQTGGSCCTSCG